jgi:hypothetical protein
LTKFAVVLALTIAATPALAGHCTPPKQPPGTGNSLMTWHKPKDCPLSIEDSTPAIGTEHSAPAIGHGCAGVMASTDLPYSAEAA